MMSTFNDTIEVTTLDRGDFYPYLLQMQTEILCTMPNFTLVSPLDDLSGPMNED